MTDLTLDKRCRRVLVLLAVFGLLSMADLAATLIAAGRFDIAEMNPLGGAEYPASENGE